MNHSNKNTDVVFIEANTINVFCEYGQNVQKQWATISLLTRIELIKQWLTLILEHQHEIAYQLMTDIYKSYKQCVSEVIRSVETSLVILEMAKHFQPECYDGQMFGVDNKLGIFKLQPKGLILVISSFNYPINLSLPKIVAALVMGNSVILKPASYSFTSCAILKKLFNQVDFPEHIFNIVQGKGNVVVDLLIKNINISAIWFTGSVEVGQWILKNTMIHDVMLEMGGKDPAIVLNDADLEQAANAIIKGAFTYAGQRCTAIKRVIVLDEVANDLVTLLQAKITQLSVGIPKTITDDFMVTPLINEAAALFADTLINDALQAGAHIASQNGYKRDLNLVFPTLLDNVAINSRIALEEQFAPILPIIRVKTIDEAIEIANGTIYGLQTSLFTKDINGAFKIADKLHAGTVNINAESQRSPDHFPFLGIKSSSFGGSQSIKDFLLASVIKKGIILNIKT